MDGKALAGRIRAEVAQEAKVFDSLGLATVLVGEDPASEIYIRRKHEAAREAGITAQPTTTCPRRRRRTSYSP